MKAKEIIKVLTQHNPEAILLEDMNEALIGIAKSFGKLPTALYDYAECVAILVERDGMSEDDAMQFIEINILGIDVCESSPTFAYILKK